VADQPPLPGTHRKSTRRPPETERDVVRALAEVDWDFADFRPATTDGIHTIHWYPAIFPPGVAGTSIDILRGSGRTFLDPFCGSGVATTEAWFRGLRAVGIDNNRFAIEMSRAKLPLVQRGTFELASRFVTSYLTYRRSLLDTFRRYAPQRICERASLDEECIRWFAPAVLAEIALIKSWIGEVDHDWRRVFTVLLSSLLHKSLSVVRAYHYTYIVDRSRVKQEAHDPVDVPSLFSSKLLDSFTEGAAVREQAKRGGLILENQDPPRYFKGLAQQTQRFLSGPADLVVTSPPYFGMNDYARSQYLSWLVFRWDGYEEDILTESGARRTRWSEKSLAGYHSDIRLAFHEIAFSMASGGYLAMVLGRSQSELARKQNPTEDAANALAEVNFIPVWKGQRRVRFRKINTVPYRSEMIWVFRKP
jgi:hypothetical protein